MKILPGSLVLFGRPVPVIAAASPVIKPVTYSRLWIQRGFRTAILALAFVFTALLSNPARAQYAIDWFTIDGGGGSSTGGVYSVSGTIGQPDAGAVMSGGPYSLSGGFWAIYAVHTPGGPLLQIFRTPTNTVVVSWPSPSAGWNLQQNTNLTTTNWVAPVELVQDNGTNRFLVVNPPTGNRFYRLILTP